MTYWNLGGDYCPCCGQRRPGITTTPYQPTYPWDYPPTYYPPITTTFFDFTGALEPPPKPVTQEYWRNPETPEEYGS